MNTNYKQLIVWEKAMELVVEVYRLTEAFPKSEIFGLTSRMRRAAVSIPSNIAEGRRRGSDAEFVRFSSIAFGSGAELETQIEIAKRIGHIGRRDADSASVLLDEIMRMLNALLRKHRDSEGAA